MTVEIATSLAMGLLMIATSIAMIALDYTDVSKNDIEKRYIDWAPELVRVIIILIASAFLILLMFARKKSTFQILENDDSDDGNERVDNGRGIRSLWSRYFKFQKTFSNYRPTFHEIPSPPMANMRLFGIALFLIVGVYVEDYINIIGEINCHNMWHLCSNISQLAIRIADLAYRCSRLFFTTTAAILYFKFRSRRFERTFITLSSLIVVAATALTLLLESVIEESDFERHRNSFSTNDTIIGCNFSSILTDQLMMCIERNTPVFNLADTASPYLTPLNIELLMLFLEINIAWYFQSTIPEVGVTSINPTRNEPTVESDRLQEDIGNQEELPEVPEVASRSQTRNDPTVESDRLVEDMGNQEELREEPEVQQVYRDLDASNLYQYVSVLVSGALNVIFIILGVLATLGSGPIDKEFSKNYASFRIVYWSLLSMVAVIGYIITRRIKRCSRASKSPTGFEYFIILTFTGALFFQVFTMVTTIIFGEDVGLIIAEQITNTVEEVIQIIFYFWARGVSRQQANHQLISYFDVILIYFALSNLAIWFQDSFMETSRKVYITFHEQFHIHWRILYNVLKPVLLLYRFNCAALFFELRNGN